MASTDTSTAVNNNLASWNDRAHAHANGGYGDLDALAHDHSRITGVAQRDFAAIASHLPNHTLEGLRVLHLQCHIGTDTVCWARMGASEVWGIDFSPVSLEYARAFAEKAGVTAAFVQGDVRNAAETLADRCGAFDVIVTSAGTITWLPELDAWAQSIEKLLAPGGVFMIRDDHPMLFALDNEGLTVVQGCFGGTEVAYEEDSSYVTDPSCEGKGGRLSHTVNHNWAHDFQEIIGALLEAGLCLESLREYDVADWRSLPMLEFDERDESWHMPDGLPRIPLTFSIVARKPR